MTTSTTAAARIRIVWDWNGTVRDDLSDHVAALNATLPALGGRPVSVDTYRAQHRVPIRSFYDHLLGRSISDEEWASNDAAFLAVLGQRPVKLRSGIRQVMLGLRARGIGQSLLSLAPHERLLHEVRQVGIAGLMDRIDGRVGPSVSTKAPALAAHLAALGPGIDPATVIVIGDSADDAVAARAVGAVPVLHTGGLHCPERLATAGAPLVDTLAEAVETGLAAIAARAAATR
ncbi:HAD family hydrolase [Kitasatospora sp. NPDC097605]|uniref:HAD family hydrolase n=1 Tax=Kitasatospora sp. NPDC097605 TaxID=3157226 RepID=UPI0033273E51